MQKEMLTKKYTWDLYTNIEKQREVRFRVLKRVYKQLRTSASLIKIKKLHDYAFRNWLKEKILLNLKT